MSTHLGICIDPGMLFPFCGKRGVSLKRCKGLRMFFSTRTKNKTRVTCSSRSRPAVHKIRSRSRSPRCYFLRWCSLRVRPWLVAHPKIYRNAPTPSLFSRRQPFENYKLSFGVDAGSSRFLAWCTRFSVSHRYTTHSSLLWTNIPHSLPQLAHILERQNSFGRSPVSAICVYSKRKFELPQEV